MDCHKVGGSTIAAKTTTSLLLYFHDSYTAFRIVVMARDSWIFKEWENVVSELSKAVLYLSEFFFELVQILI